MKAELPGPPPANFRGVGQLWGRHPGICHGELRLEERSDGGGESGQGRVGASPTASTVADVDDVVVGVGGVVVEQAGAVAIRTPNLLRMKTPNSHPVVPSRGRSVRPRMPFHKLFLSARDFSRAFPSVRFFALFRLSAGMSLASSMAQMTRAVTPCSYLTVKRVSSFRAASGRQTITPGNE